jgi:hypothetical protein
MRSGNKVRITAQLIRAHTEKHLWAESYDRDLSEVLALQRVGINPGKSASIPAEIPRFPGTVRSTPI